MIVYKTITLMACIQVIKHDFIMQNGIKLLKIQYLVMFETFIKPNVVYRELS